MMIGVVSRYSVITAVVVMLGCLQLGSSASVTVEANATIEGDTATLVCTYVIDTHPLVELTWSRLNDSAYVDVYFSNDSISEVLELIDSGSTGSYYNESSVLSHQLTIPNIRPTDETTYRCTVVDSADVATLGSADLDVLVGCESAPCQNAGVCNDTSGTAVCECDPNYSGDFCETLMDECSSDPCLNGGTCEDHVNNYTCTCLDCYTGYNCESQKVDECASSPCENGATCLDECDQFVCECDFNYQGTLCAADCDNILTISQPQVIELGSSGTLSCTAVGGATSTWWSRSTTGSPSLSTTSSYVIDKVLEAHVGTYYCFVEAAGCTSRRSTVLDVTFEIFPNTTTKENVTLKTGKSRDFECSAEGTPTPTVQWYFTAKPQVADTENGTVTVAPPSAVAIGNGSLSSFTLELKKVKKSDEGTYECVATLADSKDITIKVINVSIKKKGGSSGLKDWEIALIVIACLIIVAIIIAVIVFFILKKKSKRGNSGGRRTSTVEPSRARPTHRPQTDQEMRKSPAPYSYSDDYEKKGRANDDYAYAPRALPVPPEGGRGGKLPSLDVEEERDRLQKKKKKRRQHIDEDYRGEQEEKDRFTE